MNRDAILGLAVPCDHLSRTIHVHFFHAKC